MSTLGDFEILKEIEAGPLGTHYLGEHRFFKRPFLLKVLDKELSSDSAFLKRFEEGISSLAKLDHPHLAKVHNVSFSEGKYFLVTDFVGELAKDTPNLFHYLSTHTERMHEEELFLIVKQIALALEYLHENHLAHGSLNLNNVLVKVENGECKLSLIDAGLAQIFGISALLERKALKNKNLWRPFYEQWAFLAPEQKTSDSCDLARADIYAFGVLVYDLIARKMPEGFFSLPSHLVPEYKLGWDHLVIQCLQPDPQKRPTSLKVLMDELQQHSGSAKKTEKLKPKLQRGELVRPEFDEDPGAIFQREASVGKFQPQPQEKNTQEPLQSEMVVIQGGNFSRGSMNGGRDEMPRHEIILNSFAIDVHPVTNEQFVRFLDAMGGEKDAQNNDIIRLKESRIKRSAGKLNIESGYAKHPVVGVTWYGAYAYSKWVGKRLPTEAEWEIAACGGLEEAMYPTGATIERSQANFFSSDTTPVMSYPANSYGLFDIAGNVYEWCQDWYGYHYYDVSVQEPNNPQGPHQGVYRVLRGGCWKSLKEDLRCSHRHRNNPGTMNGTYGFRCAADVS
jgi:formylglycine-generating enzyme required for sulfatase activity